MIEFTETSRTMETKVGDYFYKMIVETTNGRESFIILRTKLMNTRNGFGSFGSVGAVQTVTETGKWGTLLANELIRFPSQEAVINSIEGE